MKNTVRIGALISGGGTNLQAIIDACGSGKINGNLVFVGADKSDAYGLERAKKHGIPTFVVNYGVIIKSYKNEPAKAKLPTDFNYKDIYMKQSIFKANTDPETVETFLKTRAIAENELIGKMSAYPFDLLVLAGFMRNLTPYFIDKINIDLDNPRIMNIHPAILPAFPGVDGYGDTFRYGCKVGGCTVHFIDYGEDSGPIIAQKTFEIREDDSLDTVKKKGLVLEWELYPQCIQLFAERRLKTVKKSYVLANGKKLTRTVVKIE